MRKAILLAALSLTGPAWGLGGAITQTPETIYNTPVSPSTVTATGTGYALQVTAGGAYVHGNSVFKSSVTAGVGVFGPAFIGGNSGAATLLTIGNNGIAQTNFTNAAIYQTATGGTTLNSASGQVVDLSINGTRVTRVTTSELNTVVASGNSTVASSSTASGFGVLLGHGASGGCIMLTDTDNAGWTECKALNGTLSCATDADGVCD